MKELDALVDSDSFDKAHEELTRLKTVQGPKFLHIITTKGKGLSKAEKEQIT